ncbi:MAG: prepilin-type N-terminal cleavage/methylation domain-containing protein [Pirellulaceae bacterium]
MTPHRSQTRRGLTLMEVILSIAILGGALATIGELIRIGARNAAAARDLSLAQIYCETKLNEVAAGVVSLDSTGSETLDEAGEWQCEIATGEASQPELIAVIVTVQQNPDTVSNPVSFSLTRWIIDPAFAAECAALDADFKAQAKQAALNAAQSSSSASSAGQSGSGDAGGDGSGSGGGMGSGDGSGQGSGTGQGNGAGQAGEGAQQQGGSRGR